MVRKIAIVTKTGAKVVAVGKRKPKRQVVTGPPARAATRKKPTGAQKRLTKHIFAHAKKHGKQL